MAQAPAFDAYLRDLAAAIQLQDGPRLRALIALDSCAAAAAVAAARARDPAWAPAPAAVAQRLPSDDWAEFATLHAAALAAAQAGAAGAAYDRAVGALAPFLRLFREAESDWVVPPMLAVVETIRRAAGAAERARAAAGGGGAEAGPLADAGDQLRKCFSVALQAPGHAGKKGAALAAVNASIKVYFRLGTLRLCRNLARSVASRQFPPFESFPAAQRVTYRFYEGRLAVLDEAYADAEAALSYALRHCPPAAAANRARVLKYLVPVALLLGRLPSPALAARHPSVLAPYAPLVAALRSGDAALFENAMEAEQAAFIRDGTYLLLEKLRFAVHRRLLRRVWALHAAADPPRAAQVPLAWFEAALRGACGQDVDADEVECIAANLIYRRYVRGYISHRARVMVVAKADPFPPLAGVSLSEA
jgi:hypothetical protein